MAAQSTVEIRAKRPTQTQIDALHAVVRATFERHRFEEPPKTAFAEVYGKVIETAQLKTPKDAAKELISGFENSNINTRFDAERIPYPKEAWPSAVYNFARWSLIAWIGINAVKAVGQPIFDSNCTGQFEDSIKINFLTWGRLAPAVLSAALMWGASALGGKKNLYESYEKGRPKTLLSRIIKYSPFALLVIPAWNVIKNLANEAVRTCSGGLGCTTDVGKDYNNMFEKIWKDLRYDITERILHPLYNIASALGGSCFALYGTMIAAGVAAGFNAMRRINGTWAEMNAQIFDKIENEIKTDEGIQNFLKELQKEVQRVLIELFPPEQAPSPTAP